MKTQILSGLGLLACLLNISSAYAEDIYTIGIGGGVASRYAGSRDYRAILSPVLTATFDNGIYASSLDGVGYTKNFANGLYVKGSFSYDTGRKTSNSFDRAGSSYLAGMGEISGAVMFSSEAGVHITDKSTIGIAVDTPLTHRTNGTSAHIDFTTAIVNTESDNVAFIGSVHGGSAEYMQTWYGVTSAQSATSGFRPYALKRGADDVSASLKWTHQLSKEWFLGSSAQVTRLVGKTDDSPIVQSHSGYSLLTSINYRF